VTSRKGFQFIHIRPKDMKKILLIPLLSAFLTPFLSAQTISLVQAAEMVTNFMKVEKIEGKPMDELFSVSALRRSPVPEKVEPTTPVWKAELEETSVERTTEATNAVFLVDGKKYRRIVEIRSDGSVVIGKMYAEPRPMIVRPKVVPAAE